MIKLKKSEKFFNTFWLVFVFPPTSSPSIICVFVNNFFFCSPRMKEWKRRKTKSDLQHEETCLKRRRGGDFTGERAGETATREKKHFAQNQNSKFSILNKKKTTNKKWSKYKNKHNTLPGNNNYNNNSSTSSSVSVFFYVIILQLFLCVRDDVEEEEAATATQQRRR